jgi:hypothetical protein
MFYLPLPRFFHAHQFPNPSPLSDGFCKPSSTVLAWPTKILSDIENFDFVADQPIVGLGAHASDAGGAMVAAAVRSIRSSHVVIGA